jgi:hypothetical protein
VRKIIGTAEDYRRLYGEGVQVADTLDKTPSGFVAPAAPAAKPAPKAAAPAKKKPAPKVTPSPPKPRPKAAKR